MMIFTKRTNKRLEKNVGENWKNKNKEYLKSIEKFLDLASNIKDEDLKNRMINNMLICDKILTQMANEMFVEQYNNGFRDGRRIN